MPSVIDEDKLVTENMGLINMAIKRYLGFGVDYEDLFQIGAVGLIKAARGFDASKNLKFSTYAVAKIIGEVKTYLRDNGEIKVPRSVKRTKNSELSAHTRSCCVSWDVSRGFPRYRSAARYPLTILCTHWMQHRAPFHSTCRPTREG